MHCFMHNYPLFSRYKRHLTVLGQYQSRDEYPFEGCTYIQNV